jgi:hypothetical protein
MSDTTQTAMTVANDTPPRPAVVKAPLTAGSTPRAIVPVDFDGAYRIANVVFQSGMAPKTLNSMEKCMVAILHGLEVGLTPMNALQSIAVINGRPTIWGDGAIGLIRASGLLEYMEEFYENEGDPLKMKAVCIVKRKGEPKTVRGDFSMADAKTAGLLGKDGPWQTYPKRMLKMRARWPLRDTFADVLKGLALKEEVEDQMRLEAEPRRVAPPPPEGQAEAAQAEVQPDKPQRRTAPPPPEETKEEEGTKPGEFNAKLWLESLDNAFGACEDAMSIAGEQERLMLPHQNDVSPAHWSAAVKLVQNHLDRVSN